MKKRNIPLTIGGDSHSPEQIDYRLKEAIEIAKKAGAKKLYLAHLSQRYDGNERLILKEAQKKFKKTIIAEDLMNIVV